MRTLVVATRSLTCSLRTSVLRQSPYSWLRHGGNLVSQCRSSSSDSTSTSSSSTASSSRVEITINDHGIARVALNRPHKLNAVDMDMFYAIRDTIQQLH